jgi:SAM-dependent methyltransferase
MHEKYINERLMFVLGIPELRELSLEAYATAFEGMGFPAECAGEVLKVLEGNDSLEVKEAKAWELLAALNPDAKGHIGTLAAERRNIMLDQIGPWLPEDSVLVVDYGAGNGAFMRLVANRYPQARVEGWDVVGDDEVGDVKVYDGERVPRGDRHYDLAYATTVLHHMEDPIQGARELVRLAKRRIILIETIPGNRTGKRDKDWNVTFVVDCMWRLLHRSSEPVPGSYRTVSEWADLFCRLGVRDVLCVENLGHDQKTMTEQHALLVFEL